MKNLQHIISIQLLCHEVRRRVFQTILNAGSGHIGGSSSSVELMGSLYFGGILRFDPLNPKHFNRDRVLVRGHLGPLRYSIFSLLGWITEEELSTYRLLGSKLQGHECMDLVSGIDITPSGSLGMLLSYGVGSAFALRAQGLSARAYVFLGDGEEQEGNVSEAARHGGHLGLSNLVCIIDKNKKQLSRPTETTDSSADIATIWKGYGWSVKKIQDGHSISEILNVFSSERSQNKPTLIIANTNKGHGIRGAENHPSGYHTISRCRKEYVEEAIKAEEKSIGRLSEGTTLKDTIQYVLQNLPHLDAFTTPLQKSLHVEIKPQKSDGFSDGLVSYLSKLVTIFRDKSNFRFYSLTADWTIQDVVKQCGFDQDHIKYLDVGIREQHLFAMAHGISVTDNNSRILIVCGDCFILRASDQLNTISQARSKMIIFGTDSGICETVNGATHQSTGQPGALINMPGLTILEPADIVDLTNCLNWAFNTYSGPIYLRLHDGIVTRLPVKNKKRNISAYVAYQPINKINITVVASGLTIEGSINLAIELDRTGKGIKVINVINAKDLDYSFVKMLEDNVPVLTVYNGNPSILQSAVSKAVMEYNNPRPTIIRGHGFTLGTTGRLDDLLEYFHFNANGIKKIINIKFPGIIS